MHFEIDLKNYKESFSVFKRTAVRGIVRKEDKYLLIASKYGDHKFPGGGMDKGESLLDTLVREVAEETGYQVMVESAKEFATVHERRKGGPTIAMSEARDRIDMTSYYYICQVKEEMVERNLDDYEEEYDYQIVWMTLEEAIRKNERVKNQESLPWVIRELKIMEALQKENI